MLRSATLRDLELVLSWVHTARECELWAGARVPFPLGLHTLAASIDFPHQGGLVLPEGNDIVAFGQIVSKTHRRAHLARLIVAPDCRGRGLGTLLVTQLITRTQASGCRLTSLNVDPSNTTAIGLYSKLGFTDAKRPDDEPDPFGSRYMELRL
jgi:ribosomal protein S18 acetylase RimI-like enzyme